MTTNTQNRPWYLKQGWVDAMLLIVPPIGIVYVLINKNRWQKDEKQLYLGLAIIMGIFWFLTLFSSWASIIFACIAYLIIHIWPEELQE